MWAAIAVRPCARVWRGLAHESAHGYETYMDPSDYEKMGTVVEAVTRTDGISDPRNVGDMVGALIAGGRAAHVIGSSVTLFEAGGNVLLSEGTKTLLRNAAERGAENALGYAAGRVLGPATMAKMPNLLAAAADVAAASGPFAVRAAVKELLKGAGRAGGFGFVIDGTIASLEAVIAIRDRGVDRRSAVKHVAKEAVTGAASTGAGVLLAAGMVALTGGAAAPVVFAVGAGGALGAKRWLRRLTMTPAPPAPAELGAEPNAPATDGTSEE